jgi:hypothetical protein
VNASAKQRVVEANTPGATIIPIILSTDKTQLTQFRNKSAYPIYMTIGNIPKSIRRKPTQHAYALLGYLPTSKFEQIQNKAARRRTLANVYHACMHRILMPMKLAGETGMHVTSGDGIVRRGHPILATVAIDYQEQVLVAGVKTGLCPICPISHDELGDNKNLGLRDLNAVLDALDEFDKQSPSEWNKTCKKAGIKPLPLPFWAGLPYTNIFCAFSSDVLHQLYQGVVKHVIVWVQQVFPSKEIDARCRRLPPNHHIRLFMKGITGLSRISGKEHDQICHIILGLLINIPLPHNQSPARLLGAVRAILDFLYLAQYPVHTNNPRLA